MCDCEDNYPEFYTHETPKANKQHNCCECKSIISKGEKYHRHSGKWDSGVSSFKVCNNCQEIADELLDCWCFTELYEELSNSDLISLVEDEDNPEHWEVDPCLEIVKINDKNNITVRLKKPVEVAACR